MFLFQRSVEKASGKNSSVQWLSDHLSVCASQSWSSEASRLKTTRGLGLEMEPVDVDECMVSFIISLQWSLSSNVYWGAMRHSVTKWNTSVTRRNLIRHMGAYTPTIRKTFWNVKKIRTKIFVHIYIDILCAHINFREKTNIFCNLHKKTKKSHVDNFFNTKIRLCYTWHWKCLFSVEQLCERVEFWNVPIKFCVWIFQHFESVYKTPLPVTSW
jgi:hypothetical protein